MPETTATRAAGTPPRPEPATAQVEIPANVYRAAETAYRHAVATGIPVAAHLVRIITPIVRQGAYADGWTDGREHGKWHGRELAANAIQAWADTPPGPWDWAAPHVVDGAIKAARGDQADEGANRGE